MARNLDMKAVLAAADQRRFSFFRNLTDNEKKEFVYSIVLRWANSLTGAQDAATDYLIKINERVNLHGEMMWKNPDLVFAMLASCSKGRGLRREYLKPAKKQADEDVLLEFISRHQPGCNEDEMQIILSKLDKAAFTQLVVESGLEAEEQKKINAAYSKAQARMRNGI